MASGIYLIQNDDRLVEMREQTYDSEALLQVLAGDQTARGERRRWLLIARELGVTGEEEGSGRWAVGHLFLDQDAIPAIVEVKRSSDNSDPSRGGRTDARPCGERDPARRRGALFAPSRG